MITSTVRRTVRERALVSPGDHVLVACSGGPDSTALLHVLHRLRGELGITFCVASIDHGLRSESASEVEQVGAFAGELGVPFYCVRVELDREGSRFRRAPASFGIARFTRSPAHRRSRVCGRAHPGRPGRDGARADAPRRRAPRPRGDRGPSVRWRHPPASRLPPRRRADYALERGLPFVDDPSNHQRTFERVRIRHEVLPTLLAEDPRVVEHLCALGDEAAELNAYLDASVPELPPKGEPRSSRRDPRRSARPDSDSLAPKLDRPGNRINP